LLAGFRSLLLAIAACIAVPVAANGDAVVDAPAGSVRGHADDGLQIFKGIPYAAPPTGERRWRPPVEMARWDGVRDATEFGPSCVQPGSLPNSIYFDDPGRQSEDCLSLNIWAPEDAEGLPVFVWIYGGALWNGSSRFSMYDGSELARHGLIVVSINYRVGVLGYMAHPELSAESEDGISGNYGLLDQIAALQWINRNIASFGGDPGQVTIAGESAGALSVMYLMASPRARGLFHRAIAQSAYMLSTPELRNARFGMPSAEGVGSWLQEQVGAESLAELRAREPRGLTMAAVRSGYIPWGTIDGQVLPRQIVDIFDDGEQAPVPMIAGFNSGEIRSLRRLLPPAADDAEAYEAAIRSGYGEFAETALRFYPPGNIDEAMLAATRDAMYGWTAERLVAKQTALGIPGYFYLFDHGYRAADQAGLHAFHASEIPFVFGTTRRTPPNWPEIPRTGTERSLSRAMTDYWASFARDGAPVADGQSDWAPYGENEAYMYFAETPRLANHLLPGMYELHEQVMCRRRAADVAWTWNVGIAAPPLPPQASGCR
jgi:para-nitrobenzyl esterase